MSNSVSRFNKISLEKTTVALLSLLVATCAIAFSGIFIRLSQNEIGPSETIFNRLWMTAIIFGLLAQLQKRRDTHENRNGFDEKELNYSPSRLILLLGAGVTFSLSQIFWAWSLVHTTVTLSTLLHNLTPLFACLGSWLWMGQNYNRQFIIGMLVSICGCLAIGWTDFWTQTLQWQGDGVAVISAVLYASYILLVKQLRQIFSTVTLIFSISATGSVVCLPFILFSQSQLFPISIQGWLTIVALALICQALGQGLIAYALDSLSSGLVALSHLSEPVLTALLAWLIFSEQLNWFTGSAFFLIMLGLYLAVASSYSTDGDSL